MELYDIFSFFFEWYKEYSVQPKWIIEIYTIYENVVFTSKRFYYAINYFY